MDIIKFSMNIKLFQNKYFLSFLFGILLTLTQAPFFIFPAIFIAFSGLFLILDKAGNQKEALKFGFCFGLGHFITGLYWVSISLLVDPIKFGWLIPFAILGIPAVISIFIVISSFIFYKFKTNNKFKNLLLFVTSFFIGEVLRSNIFTGFPWLLSGYALNFSDITMQMASIFGIYGQCLLTIFIGTSAIFLLNKYEIKFFLPALLLILFNIVFGYYRLENNPVKYTDTNIRVIQANIDQKHIWNFEYQNSNLLKHISLTKYPGTNDFIIWPESGLPYDMNDKELLHFIGKYIPRNSYLITGALRRGKTDNKLYNSIAVINDKAEIEDFYDKHKLVPFGEYIPFRNIFVMLEKITHNHGSDLSKGIGPKTIKIKNEPSFASIICYEAIFTSNIIDIKNRPDWILNVTNDGWFGFSTGPFQHLEMARLRSVEYGLPLVRAANTGISAVIDPYGRILNRIGLNNSGIIEDKIPAKAPTTFYTKNIIALFNK